MTFQSSFLIRCWLQEEAGVVTLKTYQVQHVQSGAEFRSTDWGAVGAWMERENQAWVEKTQREALGGGK